MSLFDMKKATPLGKGKFAPAGSIVDKELAKLVSGYKRTIASRYRALTPEELDQLPKGGLWVSPKIDGQVWFLVIDDEEVALVAPNGKVITGNVPVLAEAKKFAMPRAEGRLVLAGELFALRKDGRPRCGDVAKVLGGGADAEVERMGFHCFDLLTGGDSKNPGPMPQYGDRLEAMQRLCKGGKRLQAIKTVEAADADGVRDLFEEWVEGGKGEGLVARSKEIGRIFKIKPVFSLDAAVIAFTERADETDQVRSMLLAVMKENGQFQVIGSCGNMGTADFRKEMHEELAPDAIKSGYSYASSSGALFKFVKPRVVVQVKVTDIQTEDSAGKPIKRMVLELGEDDDGDPKWIPVAPLNGVSILHPVFERIRDDKEVNPTDVRAQQVLERVFIEDVDQKAEKIERPKSELLRREVYAKVTKGKTAVRKLLVWKTNKDEDPDWPAFVVHFTDYSPGRKDPLKREVRVAPDEDAAEAIAEQMLTDNIKRGWKKQ